MRQNFEYANSTNGVYGLTLKQLHGHFRALDDDISASIFDRQ